MTETAAPICSTHRDAGTTAQALLLVTLALLALGVVVVNSAIASVAEPGPWFARADVRHAIFAAMAALVLLIGARVDYRHLASGERFPVAAAVLLGAAVLCAALAFVPGIGHAVRGYHRWIRVGPSHYRIGFQPSELVKVALVIFLAAYLSRRGLDARDFRRAFLPCMLISGVCLAPIVTEDFGTAAVIALAAAGTMLLAGVPVHHLMVLIPPAAAALYYFVGRSGFRMARIAAMFDPWSQTNPSAYQPRQALVAIISGGWFGRGPGKGILKFGFLPEDSTDFVFASYCEEWGFVGAAILIAMVALWIWLARRSALRAADRFGRTLAGSLGLLIALQAVMHVAVNLSRLPPTGIALPFVSAGGTSLVILAGATALVISVAMRSRLDAQELGPPVRP